MKNASVIQPKTLAMLCRVLDESCDGIVATRLSLSTGAKDDLRISVAQLVLAAFDRGEVDPAKLKQIAVRNFAPSPEDVG